MKMKTKFKKIAIGMIPEDWDRYKVKEIAKINIFSIIKPQAEQKE